MRESERDGFYCNSIVETYNLEALQCHRVSIELDAGTAMNRHAKSLVNRLHLVLQIESLHLFAFLQKRTKQGLTIRETGPRPTIPYAAASDKKSPQNRQAQHPIQSVDI